MPHRRTTRRGFLGTVGALPVLGMAAELPSYGVAVEQAELKSRSAAKRVSDQLESARLKALDLSGPDVADKRKQMPVGRIGSLSVSRLISGSNLISMNMHARDLAYMRTLAARYNTEERIFITLKKCEEFGVNAIVLKNHNFRQ